MTPPQKKPDLGVSLSDAELKALEDFAKAAGMSVEEAASHAAQQQLQARYVVTRRTATVLTFPR